MRYFLDTEFIEDRDYLELISIGIVAEDGRELYAESSEVDWSRANAWVLENVKPHLGMVSVAPGGSFVFGVRGEIARAVRAFIGQNHPEFWSYFAAYDWVLFCRLFGTMMDLPKSWPYYCLDLAQWMKQLDVASLELPDLDTPHHALADARWHAQVWAYLKKRSLIRASS